MDKLIEIEVAFALPDKQTLLRLSVPINTTVSKALEISDIYQLHPEISGYPVGIFSKRILQPEQHILQADDRVEIYRPLQADPKEVRRRRAEKAKNKA